MTRADGEGHAPVGGRLVRLAPRGAALHVTPAHAPPAAAAFDPFPFPRLPVSLVAWLSALVERFWRERSACLAAVLLLDPDTRRWVPVLPHQRCGRRRARWSPTAGDFAAEPDGLRLAGSFQTLTASNLFTAAAAVPPFDGVHIVEQQGRGRGSRCASFLFLHLDGAPHVADPSGVLTEDVGDALRRYADRLKPG